MARAVNWNNVSMLTPGMKNLGNQFNARWPDRDGTSDGAIGDYAHQQGISGHNPDDTQFHNAEWDSDSDNTPEIRAIDVDSDLGGDVSAQQVVDHIRRLPNVSSVIWYIIYNRKIYVAPDFDPVTYTGSSPHTEHIHFSGAKSQAADNNSTFDYQFEKLGDDMPLNEADFNEVENRAKAGIADFYWDAYHAALNDDYYKSKTPAEQKAMRNARAIVTTVSGGPTDLTAVLNGLASIDIPTAQENAEAVVEALGGLDVDTLAETLRNVLGATKTADLKAAL